MNLFQFVSIKLVIFLITGIIIGYYWEPPFLVVLSVSLFSLIILGVLLFYKSAKYYLIFGISASIATISLGMGSIGLHSDLSYKKLIAEKDLKAPHLWKLQIREVLKSTEYYHRYIAAVQTVDNMKVNGKILCRLSVEGNQGDLSVDDLIWLSTDIEEISAPLNPHQFNYKNYLQNMGIYHQIRLRPNEYIHYKSDRTSLFGYAEKIRNVISEKLRNQSFGSDEMSIIQALLLGQKGDISNTTYSHYRNAGALHILAVSGLHIGIILVIIQYLLKPLEFLPRGRLIKLILTILLLWAYALIAGFSASVIRAVTMFCFVAYSFYLNRPGSTFNILALAMFFTLIFIDPLLLFQVGFQLSYAAVFAIVWIYPKIVKIWMPRNLILGKAWQIFAVGLAAQAGVLPISLYYFHQFPGLFFISNMIIVPFLGLILSLGLLIIALAFLGRLPKILADFFNNLIRTMNTVVEWVASQETFLFQNIYFDQVLLWLSYGLLLLIVWTLEKPKTRKLVAIGFIILSIQIWNGYKYLQTGTKEHVTIMHMVGESALFYHNGNSVRIFANRKTRLEKLVSNYTTAERISSVFYDSLQNSFRLHDKKLLVLNNSALLNHTFDRADYILLALSPRINLDRYLERHRPEKVIADGSNYSSDVERWKKSCEKRGIPFHSTAQDGALIIRLH